VAATSPIESDPVRVVIADDQVHFRTGLRLALESSMRRVEVVGEAGSGAEAVALVQELRPDVALLDIRMPGGDGLTAAEAILAVDPGTRILMLTVSDDPDDLLRANEAGVAGYLLKERSLQDVLAAVLSVAAGSTWPVPVS
jgi:DNA-binding NarL/FixJ family response regulator